MQVAVGEADYLDGTAVTTIPDYYADGSTSAYEDYGSVTYEPRNGTATVDYSYEGLMNAGEDYGSATSESSNDTTGMDYSYYGSGDGSGDYGGGSGDYEGDRWWNNMEISPTDDESEDCKANLATSVAKRIESFYDRASSPEQTFLKRLVSHVYKHIKSDDT